MSSTRETDPGLGAETYTTVGAGQGIGSLLGRLADDLQALVRGELRLAKAELNSNISQIVTGGAAAAGGAVLAMAGLVVLLEGGAVYVAKFIPLYGAMAAVGGGALVIGGGIAWAGSSALSLKTMAPDRSTSSLRKDIHVIKERS